MDQTSTNNMDGEYSTAGKSRAGLPVQGNVVQSRAGQSLQVQGRTYISVLQRRLTV